MRNVVVETGYAFLVLSVSKGEGRSIAAFGAPIPLSSSLRRCAPRTDAGGNVVARRFSYNRYTRIALSWNSAAFSSAEQPAAKRLKLFHSTA